MQHVVIKRLAHPCDASMCTQVAPLRVRPADVADLQKLFVRGIAKSRGQGSLALTPEAVLQLESYSFPGNIKVWVTSTSVNESAYHTRPSMC